MNRATVYSAFSLLFVGCTMSPSTPHPVPGATAEQKAALLDRVKSLAGTWEMTDEKGQSQVATVFAVTSKGSSVREIMFPGAGHEMTNMYHMDGPSIVMVHYCAEGNEPKMRAAVAGADRIEFKFDSVSNLTAADENYMGEMTLIFKDADNIREEWHSIENGKRNEHAVTFDLKRKKS